jgi:hypothetical protein
MSVARVVTSILCGFSVGVIAAAVLSYAMVSLWMTSMGSGFNLFSLFLGAPAIVMGAVSLGLVLGTAVGFLTYAGLSRSKETDGEVQNDHFGA